MRQKYELFIQSKKKTIKRFKKKYRKEWYNKWHDFVIKLKQEMSGALIGTLEDIIKGETK